MNTQMLLPGSILILMNTLGAKPVGVDLGPDFQKIL